MVRLTQPLGFAAVIAFVLHSRSMICDVDFCTLTRFLGKFQSNDQVEFTHTRTCGIFSAINVVERDRQWHARVSDRGLCTSGGGAAEHMEGLFLHKQLTLQVGQCKKAGSFA